MTIIHCISHGLAMCKSHLMNKSQNYGKCRAQIHMYILKPIIIYGCQYHPNDEKIPNFNKLPIFDPNSITIMLIYKPRKEKYMQDCPLKNKHTRSQNAPTK